MGYINSMLLPPDSDSSQGENEHTYGRGTFKPHENYVTYMHMIVNHPAYEGMPNAKKANGRINWQVSTGKSTSLSTDYAARWKWWDRKANDLGLPGSGNENERFTIAARLIHPTKFKSCYICGKLVNIGYYYFNFRLARILNNIMGSEIFQKGMPIDCIFDLQTSELQQHQIVKLLSEKLLERRIYFKEYGFTREAFLNSIHLKSNWLSPGFMANPPDRLDGLHDYCSVECRATKDPGRLAENLRQYNHDRRAFAWWVEGDWNVADSLYNKAGAGVCIVEGCGSSLEKVSPDHVGPLSCGFKQIPLFVPMCSMHNSSKNRRFTKKDVDILLNYERSTDSSVVSWYVRPLWDKFKFLIESDEQAQELSNLMRSTQDLALRVLSFLEREGHYDFLTKILNIDAAYWDISFEDLHTGEFTYSSINRIRNQTNGRKSLATRVVRVAFESLSEYQSKERSQRKLSLQQKGMEEKIIELVKSVKSSKKLESDEELISVVKDIISGFNREEELFQLSISGRTDLRDDEREFLSELIGIFANFSKDMKIESLLE